MRAFLLACLLLIAPLGLRAQESASEEADKGYLTNLLQNVLSDAGRRVVIDGFRGALSSRATIERLTIADDEGIWLTVEGVVLDWNRAALLRGRLEVTEFSARRLAMPRNPAGDGGPPSPEATPFRIPNLPVSVDIARIAVERAEIGAPVLGQDAAMGLEGRAHLEGGGADVDLALTRTDGKEGEISIEARYEPGSGAAAVNLAMHEAADGIAANALNIPGAPALDLTLQGEGLVSDLTTRLAVTTEGEERLGGTIRLTGEEDGAAWQLAVDLAGDVTPLFAPDLRDFFGPDVSITARAGREADGALQVSDLSLQSRAASVEGNFLFSPDGWPRRMALSLVLADPDGAPVVLPFGEGETSVSRAALQLDFDEDDGQAWQATAEATEFRTQGLAADTLAVEANGTIATGDGGELGSVDAAVTMEAGGLAAQDPALARAMGESLAGRFNLAWSENEPLRLEAIDLAGEDFRLTGATATDGVDTGLQTGVDITLAAQDLSRFAPLAGTDLAGAAELAIEGNVTPLSGAFDLGFEGTTDNLAIGQEQVDRLLAGEGRLTLSVRRDEGGIDLRSLEARSDAAVLTASGSVASAASALDIRADLPSLAPLFEEEAEGAATLNGRVTLAGTQLQSASLAGQLSGGASGEVILPLGQALRFSGGTLELGYGAEGNRWRTTTLLRDFRTEGLAAESARLEGEGTLTQAESGAIAALDGQLALTASGLAADDPGLARAIGPEARLATRLAYRPDGPLTLSDLALTAGDTSLTGQASLAQPLGSGEISYDLALATADLARFSGLAGLPLTGRAELRAEGRADPGSGGFDAALEGSASGLGIGNALVDSLLAGETALSGRVSLAEAGAALGIEEARLAGPNLTVTASGTPSRLSIEARLADLGLIAADFSGAASASGTVTLEGGTTGLDIAATGPGGTNARIAGTLSGGQANLSITGDAPLGLANGFIAPQRLDGRAVVDLRLEGQTSLENLTGTVRTSGAHAIAPTLGISLDAITGGATLAGGQARVDLSARGGDGGQIGMTGTVGLAAPNPADLTVVAQGFVLRDPQLYDSSASGTITLSGPLAGGALIAGGLELGRTEIRIPSSGMSGLSDIPPITHRGARAGVQETRARAGLAEAEAGAGPGGGGGGGFGLDIRLSAPNQVFIRGRGLDAELGGTLQLTGTTADIVPVGAFELVRGRLDILSQRFQLTEGNARLTGSFDADLRLVATTESDGYTISVILEGSPSEPEISFISTPDLPEDEILAQLLFGRDLTNLSPLQALELANAVATLAGRGGGGLISRLREGFGLDDLDVTQSDDGGTAVRAGKYLSDNIYSDVVVEGDGTTELNLNLQLHPNVTVKGSADSGNNTGLGIFFERDY